MHIDGSNNHLHCDNVHLPQCLGNIKIDIALNTNVPDPYGPKGAQVILNKIECVFHLVALDVRIANSIPKRRHIESNGKATANMDGIML